MSQDTAAEPTAIAQAVNGFEQLEARQVTIHQWRVLSYRNGSLTAHEVDTHELTCSCADAIYNQTDDGVCDHLAVALHHAPRTLDVETAIQHDMNRTMLELEDHVETIERRAAGIKAQADVAPVEGDGNGGVQAGADATPDIDTDEAADMLTTAWADNGFDVGHSVFEGNELEFDLYHDDFDTLKAWTSESDYVEYNGENNTLALADVKDYLQEVDG